MITKLKVEDPGNIEMTLTVTMKLNDWIKLANQMSPTRGIYPAAAFCGAIHSMQANAEKHFYPETDDAKV